MPKKDLITVNNVNIQPLMESLIELVKDKKMTGELDDLINAKIPEKTSADWIYNEKIGVKLKLPLSINLNKGRFNRPFFMPKFQHLQMPSPATPGV
jgi:hypothetical protein